MTNEKPGEKSMKLPSRYIPGDYESDIYSLWEKGRAFEPKNRGSDETFSMALPPPNANANLHIGYGLTVAIYDIVTRYQRMLGKSVVMIPGADHAGFETQVVYEKQLAKEGKSRFDFSREELYKQIWDFVELNKSNFQDQIRALGASCDWSRFTYTLDDKVVAQAYDTFQKMWKEGLIYRGKRIVNFCTYHGTSFSDIEVVHEEEKTKLWFIAYPLEGGSGEVVIATTRPETKLGQSALMVNPNDKRFKDLIGKTVIQPLVPGKPIKIIGDDYVDPKFGTGVVTVTPGHDANDFEVAQRHNLPIIELITSEGKMSDQVPEKFRGLSVMEAREAVEKELDQAGYLRKVEDHMHSVGKCYKCGTVIEPLVRDQWFVKMRPLGDKAIEALESKQITFYPAGKRGQTVRYLKEVRDWNISRQIAWGIPIPAFQNDADPDDWIFDTRVDQQTLEIDGKKYTRDPDVFDTWFSSGLWPMVTLDYPAGEDFKKFYPLNLMDTAGEILYQWVARMIMLGLYNTGEVPFKDVYIHGLILAEGGAKMSKSLGNVVDATKLINEYGSDALRMGLINGRVPAVNRGYDQRKIEEARNFSNKLWNIARFTEDKRGPDYKAETPTPKSIADHWILSRLDKATKEISKALENYRLTEAYELMYHFTWHDFADWYIEASKSEENIAVLNYVLESTLKLVHPFAPFVTESIWQAITTDQGSMLTIQPWPPASEFDASKAATFQELMTTIAEIRRISGLLSINKPKLLYSNYPALAENSQLVSQLSRLGQLTEVSGEQGRGLRLTATGRSCWLDIEPQIAHSYLDKLRRQHTDIQASIGRLNSRLGSREYTEKAPASIVDQTKLQLETEQIQLKAIEEDLANFESATKDL